MNTGTVAARYAKALLEYALEKGQDGTVYNEMTVLRDRMSSIHEIHERLADPTVSLQVKQSLLETAITDSKEPPCQVTRDFLRLVLRSQREDMLLFMASAYIDRYRRHYGIVPVSLVTAVPEKEDHRARLAALVARVTKGTPEWSYTVDPRIEGGFILSVDGYRLDASVASQLERIRKELIEKNNRII